MRNTTNYHEIYLKNYDNLNSKKTLSGYFLEKSYFLLEKNLPVNHSSKKIIEVGSGTGNHFPYIKQDFEEYRMTDSNSGMIKILNKKYQKEILTNIVIVEQQDAAQLNYTTASFDRLIAIHVLEHLIDLVSVLKEWNRIVRPGGLISIVLPCDPGLLWRFGKNFGPRKNTTKAGMAYDYIQASEHVNSIFNLVTFIRYYLENIIESWFGAKFFYQILIYFTFTIYKNKMINNYFIIKINHINLASYD